MVRKRSKCAPALVKVVDPDAEIAGVIEEISLFHVIIRHQDNLITYPNSLIVQRPVIKLPRISASRIPVLQARGKDHGCDGSGGIQRYKGQTQPKLG